MVNPNSRIRLVKGDNFQQRPERIADLDMERTSGFGKAKHQATRPVLVLRIILISAIFLGGHDLEIKKSLVNDRRIMERMDLYSLKWDVPACFSSSFETTS